MTDKFTFGDLPPVTRKKTRTPQYADFAKAALEHPGQWARVAEGISGTAVKQINDGVWEEFSPAGEFQAVSRNTDASGKADVWARYVGPNPTEAELQDSTLVAS